MHYIKAIVLFFVAMVLVPMVYSAHAARNVPAQEHCLAYSFSHLTEIQRQDQARLQGCLREAATYGHPNPLVQGFALSKFAQENEYFTQESWGNLAQNPLLVALVVTRSSEANALNINLYRAHDFNQWLIGTSEYGTRSFRVDPITHEKLLSKDIYYFKMTRKSLEYLCTLDELVAHNDFGKELREDFLENAGDDWTDIWYAHGIKLIRLRDGVIQELDYVKFRTSDARGAELITPEMMDERLWVDIEGITRTLETCVRAEVRQRGASVQELHSVIWPRYKKNFDRVVQMRQLHQLPVNQFQKAAVASELHARVSHIYNGVAQGGIPAGYHPQYAAQDYHIGAFIMKRQYEDDDLWLLPSTPLVLALVHGLMNNILARCVGSFVLPLRFYQAPVREWITGSLKFAALAYLTKYAHSKFKDKAKKRPIFARLGYGAYLLNMFYMGGLQIFAEEIPLSWHGTWRTYPSHRSRHDIWFSGNVQFAFAYLIEAHLVKACLASCKYIRRV